MEKLFNFIDDTTGGGFAHILCGLLFPFVLFASINLKMPNYLFYIFLMSIIIGIRGWIKLLNSTERMSEEMDKLKNENEKLKNQIKEESKLISIKK